MLFAAAEANSTVYKTPLAQTMPEPPQLKQAHQQQEAMQQFIAAIAQALKAGPRGRAAIYAGGVALLRADGALECLGKVAAATGADIICENAFARLDRGAGMPDMQVSFSLCTPKSSDSLYSQPIYSRHGLSLRNPVAKGNNLHGITPLPKLGLKGLAARHLYFCL